MKDTTKLTARDRKTAIAGLQRTEEVIRTTQWGKGAMHWDANDNYVDYKVKEAVGHCAVGAMQVARASTSAYLAFGLYLNKKYRDRINEDLDDDFKIDNSQSKAEEVIIAFNDCNKTERGHVLRGIKHTIHALETGKI